MQSPRNLFEYEREKSFFSEIIGAIHHNEQMRQETTNLVIKYTGKYATNKVSCNKAKHRHRQRVGIFDQTQEKTFQLSTCFGFFSVNVINVFSV